MQDYFVALFIDKIAETKNYGSLIPLENGWMREPLRILAAISKTPRNLIESFELNTILDNSLLEPNDLLTDVSNLMLNCSEAIAYLPKPEKNDENSTLLSSILKKAEEAREFFLEISKYKNDSLQALKEKFLKILENIYASEFFANNQLIFSKKGKHRKNELIAWKQVHHTIQREPDFYQHSAYRNLYPICHNLSKFPVKRYSLFFYIIDVVFTFSIVYDRLYKETHPRPSSRIFVKLGSISESIISFSLLLFLVILVFDSLPFDFEGNILLGLLAMSIILLLFLLIAWLCQILGFTRLLDFYHIPAWLFLKSIKRCWIFLKFDLPYAISAIVKSFKGDVLHAIIAGSKEFMIIVLLLPIVVISEIFAGIKTFFRTRPISFVLLLITGLILTFSWPHIQVQGEIIRMKEFTVKVDKFTKIYEEQRNKFRNILAETNSASALQQIAVLREEMTNSNSELEKLQLRGSYFDEFCQKNSLEQHDRISLSVKTLNDITQEITNIKSSLSKREVAIIEDDFIVEAKVLLTRLQLDDFILKSLSGIEDIETIQRLVTGYLDELNSMLSKGKILLQKETTQPQVSTLLGQLQDKKEKLSQSIKELTILIEHQTNRTLIAQIDNLLMTTSIQSCCDKFFLSVDPILETGQGELKQIETYIHDSRNSVIDKVASVKKKKISTHLEKLYLMTSKYDDINAIRDSLNTKRFRIQSFLNEVNSIEQLPEQKLKMENQISAIEIHLQKLEQYKNFIERNNIVGLKQNLQESWNLADKSSSKQFLEFVLILSILAAGLAFKFLRQRFGDRKGRSEVEGRKNDFDKLLRLVEQGRYSLEVFKLAMGNLRLVTPETSEALEKISKVRKSRQARMGHLNEEIGRLLREELEIGLENRLDRKHKV